MEKVWTWSAETRRRYGPWPCKTCFWFDEKDTPVDAEIISDVCHMEEEYERRLPKDEQRFVQKVSVVLDPNEFLKMMSLIEYLELHGNIAPIKLLKLLAGLLPQ